MSWRGYRVGFRLRSPLHAGLHKVGNLQRTRRYVPARTMRGALVARLAATLGRTDYATLLAQVNDQLAFGYFYVGHAGGAPYQPTLVGGELRYAPNGTDTPAISEGAFDHLFLTSWASTALSPGQGSALDGSLHEVECLTPRTPGLDEVWLTGTLYVTENDPDKATDGGLAVAPATDDVQIDGHSLRDEVLPGIQAGGERRYGFGRLEVAAFEGVQATFGDGPRPVVSVPPTTPFPAHVLTGRDDAGVVAALEVLLGRETTDSKKFGTSLSAAQICWAPGGYVVEPHGGANGGTAAADTANVYEIAPDGVLTRVITQADG